MSKLACVGFSLAVGAVGCALHVDDTAQAGFENETVEEASDALTTTALPPQLCSAALAPVNVSTPTRVVGTGTAASCTESALRTAITAGGIITFNCGSAVKTIPITSTLVVPTDRDVTIDGGDKVVLDGRGVTQIMRAIRMDFRVNDRVLTLSRLTLQNGRDVGTGFVPRDGQKLCAWGYKNGGGGALSVRDMKVRLYGATFLNNRGPELGPDVAGGALYVFGSKELTIERSTFRGNSASNGGAVGMLHTNTRLNNVVLEDNHATGTNANFAGATGCPVFNHAEQGGAGGLGGAFYSDGFDPGDTLCGVRMANNSSGDMGGALFRSAYWGLIASVGKQSITWDRCTFEGNVSARGGGGAAYVNNSFFTLKNSKFLRNDAGPGDGGALKLTGITVRADTVEFSDGRAGWGGGVAQWGVGPEGKGTSRVLTFARNAPNDSVGDFPR